MGGRSVWVKTATVAIVVLCLDLITKALAASSYGLNERHEFLFLSILHVQNPGVSLGVFKGLGLISGGVQLPIYVFVVAGILGGVGLFRSVARSSLFWLPAGLLLGGFANILELLYHGYGTDFIYISGLNVSANLADFSIFLGLALFMLFDLARLAGVIGQRYKHAVAGSPPS
jgi:lipoprotein signal peptidase